MQCGPLVQQSKNAMIDRAAKEHFGEVVPEFRRAAWAFASQNGAYHIVGIGNAERAVHYKITRRKIELAPRAVSCVIGILPGSIGLARGAPHLERSEEALYRCVVPHVL
jgi:hypothetical protein